MNKKEVSLKLIANNLNLSINTVSHALRDLNDISSETKEKVIKKANELGYVMKRRKSAKKKKRVAFLINSFSNLYYNIISNELSKMFSASENFEFFIIYNDLQFIVEEDLDELFRYNPNLIISHIELSYEAINKLKRENINVVLLGNFQKIFDLDTICVDENAGSEMAARYLAKFHQTKKFLFVGEKDYYLSEVRLNIFKQTIKNISGNGIVNTFYYDGENVTDFYKLIKEGYRSVFFFNDQLAYTVLADTNKIYLNIRKLFPDLHLIGFDCLSSKIKGLIDITSIQISYDELIRELYNIIENRFNNPNGNYIHKVLPITLHQRRVIKE